MFSFENSRALDALDALAHARRLTAVLAIAQGSLYLAGESHHNHFKQYL